MQRDEDELGTLNRPLYWPLLNVRLVKLLFRAGPRNFLSESHADTLAISHVPPATTILPANNYLYS